MFLLRKIRRPRWASNPTVGARSKSGLQADALGDLATTTNTLSVWLIDDDEGNLDLVVAACAATCHPTNFDLALLSLDLIDTQGFELRSTPGDTPAPDVNRYHRDLVKLSAQDVSQLAELIFTKGKTKRVPQKKIGHLLRTFLAGGQLKAELVKPWILEKFGAS